MELLNREVQRIAEMDLKERRIMIIGRVEHVRNIIHSLKSKYNVERILDNDLNKQGKTIDGIPVDAPQNVLAPFDKKVFIVIYSPKYWEEILIQFEAYGYIEGRHIYVMDRPGKEYNKKKIKQGIKIYKEFQREYGKNVQVFLTNCPLGDYYLLSLYFEEYLKNKNIKNYVITGTSYGIEKLSYLMGKSRNKLILSEESDALAMAWKFLGDKCIHITPLTIWQGAFRFNPCVVRQMESFTFMDTFKKMIYALPSETKPRFLKFKNSTSLFGENNGLHPGKTVLLVPFAYSIQTLTNDFWCKLADYIRGKGYDVLVNIGDGREHNFIPDTISVSVNFKEILSIMEMAGTVIGIRCGLFDITCRAKCKRIILYPPQKEKNVVWNRTDIAFSSLKNMGLCNTAIELEIENEDYLLQKIQDVLLY